MADRDPIAHQDDTASSIMQDDTASSIMLLDEHIEIWRLVLTSVLAWLCTGLSVAAGIGGGGLLVPLYALVLGVGASHAIPISTGTIFGVALTNMFFITRWTHPTAASRPLIDYRIATTMQAGTLLGSVPGVLLNVMLPEIVIIGVLALVLG